MTRDRSSRALADAANGSTHSTGGFWRCSTSGLRIVEEIGRIKRERDHAIYEPKREDQVFDNVTSHNGGPAERRTA